VPNRCEATAFRRTLIGQYGQSAENKLRFYAEESFSALILGSLTALIAAMAEGIAFPYSSCRKRFFEALRDRIWFLKEE
jgi:hypothetical protein